MIKKLQVVWVSSDFIVQDLFPYTALLIHLHRCLLGLHIQPQLRFPSGIKDPVFLALSRFITTGNKSVVLFFFSPITPNSRSYRISQKLCLNSETKEIVMSHICILKTHLDLRWGETLLNFPRSPFTQGLVPAPSLPSGGPDLGQYQEKSSLFPWVGFEKVSHEAWLATT